VLPPAWQWEHVLKHLIILLLAIACGGVTFVSFSAATHANWASQLCAAANPLCQSPLTLALATTGLVSLWITVALFSAITNA
jgi:predicted lysophospholipase L1 biosynthesis ABC-type transport system permease subunit